MRNTLLGLMIMSLLTLVAVPGFGATGGRSAPRSAKIDSIMENVVYNKESGKRGRGDLYFPQGWNAETPLALTIHGGGWSGMDKSSFEGVAEFLCEQGFAVYNINYRLLGAGPWPLCGDDCLAALRFMQESKSEPFSRFNNRKVFIVGASAGGHLALMTGLRAQPGSILGIVSISGIAEIPIDRQANPGRYVKFFPGKPTPKDILNASPMGYISPNQPPILCTHTLYDKVVPIESQRIFFEKSKAVGAKIEFYQYERANDGHCIWIPGSKPHRLYPDIEQKIVKFIHQNQPVK